MQYEQIPLKNARDLSKQKFGHWQPLYRIKPPNPDSMETYWLCQCDCNGENSLRPVCAGSLTAGRSISCGCSLKSNREKYKNGDKIGHWTIISYEGDGRYKAQCDCDNHTIEMHRTNSITRKNSSCQFCRTNRLQDLTGQKFGHWTVLYRSPSRNDHTYWHCICDCENHTEKDIDAYKLKTGKSTSCGCDIESKGEKMIEQLLKENNISFETQKVFKSCKTSSTGVARFDFYVNNQYLIEYDGEQHSKLRENGWNNPERLQRTQERDMIKTQWCKANNIPLIRIPYTHFKNLCIEDLQLKTSKFIV